MKDEPSDEPWYAFLDELRAPNRGERTLWLTKEPRSRDRQDRAESLVRRALDTASPNERATATLIEAAIAVLNYTQEEMARPEVSDANLQLGLALGSAWHAPFGNIEQAPQPSSDDRPTDQQDSEVVSLALATFQALARRCETTVFRSEFRERGEQLSRISQVLRRKAHNTEWYASLLAGDRWGDATGYLAPIDAADAQTVWTAVARFSVLARHLSFAKPMLGAPRGLPQARLLTPTEARTGEHTMKPRALRALLTPPPSDDRVVEVWYGTNRSKRKLPYAIYGTDRLRELRLGRCDVFVPKEHRLGSVKRGLKFRDGTLKLQATEEMTTTVFIDSLHRALAVPAEKRALVYIHGYNTSFEDAAIRAAQLAVDLHVKGVMAFFTWPSWGSFVEYPADGEAARASWRYLAEFLDCIVHAGADRIDVVAHSMGNQVVARALGAMRTKSKPRSIECMVLAAPDVDYDTFLDAATDYDDRCASTTLYISGRDRALKFSNQLQLSRRLGLAPPVFVRSKMHTIDVSAVADSFLGHGYYGDEPRVIADIASLLDGAIAPKDRGGMDERTIDGQTYWEMVPSPRT